MKNTIITTILSILLVSIGIVQADAASVATGNQPIVSTITPYSAVVSVPDAVLKTTSTADKNRTYFEYYETNKVCIMIYPTPEHCLPKKTPMGELTTTLTNLKPNTNYTVSYKRDNEIMCVAAPCPGNGFESASVSFSTLEEPGTGVLPIFSRNLYIGMRGSDVVTLQTILRTKGYLASPSTGYYGSMTRAAVRLYQKNDMRIVSTGIVGPLTRASLNKVAPTILFNNAPPISATEETFTGKITAVSLGCFVDGECSVTVDGKKVVTTIGWAQGPVGSIRGASDGIGSLESQIGKSVKVYAKKTSEGYTLYGSNDYYIELIK